MPSNNLQPDRVMDVVLMQAGQEATQRANNPVLRRDDPHLLGLRRDQYRSALDKYAKAKDLSRDERQGIVYLRAQVQQLDARLRPTRLNRLRYARPVNWLISWFNGRAALMDGYNQRIHIEDRQIIQQRSFVILERELRKAGFTESMEGPLRRAIAQDRTSFYLPYPASDDDKSAYTLFFNKLPDTDIYYVEKFHAETKPTPKEILQGASIIRADFSMIDEPSFTRQETDRLIHQSPVARMIDNKEQWATIGIDGRISWRKFDLARELQRYEIEERKSPVQWEAVKIALRNGLTKEVTLVNKEGEGQKLSVAVGSALQGLLFKDKEKRLVDIKRLFKPNPALEKALTASEQAVVLDLHPKQRM